VGIQSIGNLTESRPTILLQIQNLYSTVPRLQRALQVGSFSWSAEMKQDHSFLVHPRFPHQRRVLRPSVMPVSCGYRTSITGISTKKWIHERANIPFPAREPRQELHTPCALQLIPLPVAHLVHLLGACNPNFATLRMVESCSATQLRIVYAAKN
jgi:hypothetical protein